MLRASKISLISICCGLLSLGNVVGAPKEKKKATPRPKTSQKKAKKEPEQKVPADKKSDEPVPLPATDPIPPPVDSASLPPPVDPANPSTPPIDPASPPLPPADPAGPAMPPIDPVNPLPIDPANPALPPVDPASPTMPPADPSPPLAVPPENPVPSAEPPAADGPKTPADPAVKDEKSRPMAPLRDSELLPQPSLPKLEPLLPGAEFLLIPDGIVPGRIPQIIPSPEVMGFQDLPPPPPPPAEAMKPEEMKIAVSKFNIRYVLSPGEKPNKVLPTVEQLEKLTVPLAKSNQLLVPPDAKAAKGSLTEVRVGAKAPKPQEFRGDALEKVSQAVVGAINKTGIYGVYVILDPAEIDRLQGKNYDKRGGKTDLSVLIYVSEVSKIRTIRRRTMFRVTDKPIVDDPRDGRIRTQSPVGPGAGPQGGLLNKPALQNYLSRLNRFPGRRVDAAINASGEERKVILDYLIREEKPLFVYAQTSNTGTESTGEIRTRLGMDYKQLLRLDDVLRIEYITTDFSKYNAFLASYEFTPIFPDYLKFKTFGTYSKYSAEDIGFDLQSFESTVWTAGGQLTWTPLYVKGFPLDLYLGMQWMHVEVDNPTALVKGDSDFALPYLGVGTERITEKFSVSANAQVQFNLVDVAGTKADDLLTLGRFNTDPEFLIGSWNLSGSLFLEPIIFGKEWDEQKVWWKSTRAHELAGSFRGQVAMDHARLVPQLQTVAGGFDTVRGYPESLFAGDSVLLATAEYRFHVPRQFIKPREAIERDKRAKEAKNPNLTPVPPKPGSKQEPKFALRPSAISTGPDYDLILRAFFDFGQTYNNERLIASERDRTLASVGGGVEMQLYKPLYLSLRMDVGYVLIEQRELLTDPVDEGDVRLHFSGAIAW